jgi:HlyD family secretion protein
VTTVQVGSQISGQVKDIYADFNTPVKKGQVIARIDPATFELRVNQTRADLDAAEARWRWRVRASPRSRPSSAG